MRVIGPLAVCLLLALAGCANTGVAAVGSEHGVSGAVGHTFRW